ncbi:hypothetical protein K458DRAFT_402804 [Lentithecium fluviatile CBS 122367]|uniref:Nuclear speckle splicing regulatory protein 1 N-terminal domain-containing protein n=1 Tax=Lentithecium fluviatile CBS 122367 TaxID=1168545 RepID=A0A6G1J7Z2_9PLEO|nr:hypothetical protein K458DRAFT_402804 [Lentithecium fluviatile CBS 122367]
MSFKFGLNVKNKALAGAAKPAKPALGKKKKPLLDDDEEDTKPKAKATVREEKIGDFNFDEIAATSTASEPEKTAPKTKGKPTGPPARKPLAKEDDPTILANSASAQEAERRAREAVEVDATIYDYDAAYEALNAKKAAKRAAEREDAIQRKPKYMDNLFESAELRKKDQLRARDKQLQREREAEGDEFADKEKFVTSAYKAQQEEARKAEAEEKKRQEAEDEKRRKFGMQGFHKQMLMEQEKRHQEAIEAAAELARSGVKIDVEEENEKTEAEIARELQAQGKDIILNDEGQVADKRQLLSAGLNIVAKPKKPTTATATSPRPAGPPLGQGRNATQRDIRARHTQMVAEQIQQAAKRKADEEAEEQRKLQHASKSQKTEGDILSAKERYLQRKREAAAAKAAAAGK